RARGAGAQRARPRARTAALGRYRSRGGALSILELGTGQRPVPDAGPPSGRGPGRARFGCGRRHRPEPVQGRTPGLLPPAVAPRRAAAGTRTPALPGYHGRCTSTGPTRGRPPERRYGLRRDRARTRGALTPGGDPAARAGRLPCTGGGIRHRNQCRYQYRVDARRTHPTQSTPAHQFRSDPERERRIRRCGAVNAAVVTTRRRDMAQRTVTSNEEDPAREKTRPKGPQDGYFGISKFGTNIPREIRAGLTTFLAMSYVIFVNPGVLSDAIQIPGVDNLFGQLVMVTCMAALLGSLYMGLIARYPFAQAPGMGLNAYFTYTVVITLGYEWQTALGAVFISGVLFVVLSVLGARKAIAQALPMGLKYAITAGIGAFLAFLGMKNAGLVVANEATFVTVGSISEPHVWLSLLGLLIIAVLMKLRVPGAILWGILGTTLIAIVSGLAVYEGDDGGFTGFPGFDGFPVAAPFWPSDLAFQMDIAGAFGAGLLSVVFTFFFVDFFDATGTLTGLSQRAGYIDEHGEMPRAKTLFSMDGLAAMSGAVLGTSTTTAYVESAAGVEEG